MIRNIGYGLTVLAATGPLCVPAAQARGPNKSKASTTVVDLDYFDAGLQQPDATNVFYGDDDGPGLKLRWGLTLFLSGVASKNANYGSNVSIGGNPVNEDNAWWEHSGLPVLRADYTWAEGGRVFGGASAVYNITRGSGFGDNTGATPNHPEALRLDQAYLGWNSGQLFADSLGEDALQFAAGRMDFAFGEGFLVGDGYFDTGKQGGYYNGVSEAFEKAAVATIDSHGWHGDLFYLEQDQFRPGRDDETRSYGANVHYRFTGRAELGAAYLKTYKSNVPALDGTDIYNLRAKGKPIPALKNLAIGGQYVYESNPKNDIDDSGWYAEASYKFQNTWLDPQLIYRRAEFSANYNTVYYDWSGGWGNWYMGEVVGEFQLFNSNLDVDMVKTKLHFTDRLNGGAIAYRFSYHNAQESAGITSRNFAKELDFYMNFNVNKHLILQAVYGFAVPDDGATQSFPDDQNADQVSHVGVLFATVMF
ncbi:hypothetical protein [Salinisphaera japonica]|uniref:Alginate export domain-containing protein n=1 Tax=Salinisphaera japonica YTM-1 TaxID=1209778 RepID=A0A423Q2Q0_9GAMM|nr:hypothetical protein [Salinisphaera japonica]ROO32927.1 hypothetical protein SAJA_01140 [Salinisphaera japonica YTM-1]